MFTHDFTNGFQAKLSYVPLNLSYQRFSKKTLIAHFLKPIETSEFELKLYHLSRSYQQFVII